MSTALSAPPDVPRSSVGRPGRGARVRWVVVALTSLAIVGYVLAVYAKGSLGTLSKSGAGLSTTYAGRALPIQVAFYCHISFAALALLVGPLQFVVAIRRRRPLLHRWIGRMFLVSVGVGSLAAGVMSLFNSAGIDGFFGFGTLAVLWAWTAWRGYTSVRAHDYASHQAWMIRCFALTYAGVTLRAWFGVLIGVQLLFAAGPIDADHVMSTAYAVLPFLSWLPNLVVAELLIRRRGLPALALTPSPTAPEHVHPAPYQTSAPCPAARRTAWTGPSLAVRTQDWGCRCRLRDQAPGRRRGIA